MRLSRSTPRLAILDRCMDRVTVVGEGTVGVAGADRAIDRTVGLVPDPLTAKGMTRPFSGRAPAAAAFNISL